MLVLRGLYEESDVKCKSELRIIEERSNKYIVAMFLYTLAHHKKNRPIGHFSYYTKYYFTIPHQYLMIVKMKGKASNQGRGKNKRYWTYKEDAPLIRYLHKLSGDPMWKSENDFMKGYMNKLEELIKSMFPNCGLKATPPH
ncbi:Formin-homology and zinc finger domains protein 1 [Bienertia sinuspersici]